MASVGENDLEEKLRALERDPALTAIERQQLLSVISGRHLMTMEEIDAEIQAVRRERRASEARSQSPA